MLFDVVVDGSLPAVDAGLVFVVLVDGIPLVAAEMLKMKEAGFC